MKEKQDHHPQQQYLDTVNVNISFTPSLQS